MSRPIDRPGRPHRGSASRPAGVRAGWRGLAAASVLLASLAASARGQAIDKQVLDRVKDATVYIKVRAGGQIRSSGSGFVMRASGDTLLVMTNRHVVATDPGDLPEGTKAELSVVLRSGTAQAQEVLARLLAADERSVRDLAVLEVRGVRQPPQPIPADATAAESEFFETMQAFALGFPRGGLIVGNANANPAVTVNAMTISSLRRDEASKLERVQFAGSMIEGNSGGPIVDAKGRLVGVVVERLRGENVGFAIPPSVIAGFLAGDVDDLVAEMLAAAGATNPVKFVARLVDPLGRIKGVAIRHARQPGTPEGPRPDPQGAWPQVPGGTSVPLTIAAGLASGQVGFPVARPDDRKVVIQVILTDSLGRAIASKPIAVTLPDRPGRIAGLGELEKAKLLAKWSCEPNASDGVKVAHQPGKTTIDLPGGVALVNAPQFGLFNAPCALTRVDGDFVAMVKVTNGFDPGGEGLVLPGGRKIPYSFQSAGLLIWQDEKNFIRLERSKGSDGKVSLVHRVLVEVYKGGREAAIHYLNIPEQATALVAVRKGGSLQLLFAQRGNKAAVFQEMALDFNKEIFVGIAASNLSRRPFQASLEEFSLKGLEGQEIVAKAVKMAKLVDSGIVKLDDGTRVLEGATLRVLSPQGAPAGPQTNMADYKAGRWSDDRQLVWNAPKSAEALTLEIPVDADGKYEIKAKFTLAPDYAIARLDIDGKPLNKGQSIDFYSVETRPTKLMSLGTYSLNKGKRKLTVTIFNKNAKSTGFHFGLDEIQLVPAK